MGRRPKVQRSAEEKFAIVLEGLKSGKVSETCRKHDIGPALFYRWKDEMEKGALAALGGGAQPRRPTKSRPTVVAHDRGRKQGVGSGSVEGILWPDLIDIGIRALVRPDMRSIVINVA